MKRFYGLEKLGILEEMEDGKVIGLIETIIKKLLFLLRFGFLRQISSENKI